MRRLREASRHMRYTRTYIAWATSITLTVWVFQHIAVATSVAAR